MLITMVDRFFSLLVTKPELKEKRFHYRPIDCHMEPTYLN